MVSKEAIATLDTFNPEAASEARFSNALHLSGMNRHERRRKLAEGRKLRKQFTKYKSHMQSKGYDATFTVFMESIP